MNPDSAPLGAWAQGPGRWSFRVWAPRARLVELILGPECRVLPLRAEQGGYHVLADVPAEAGARYAFRLDGEGRDLPDPASRFQPDGVHGPSALVDSTAWVRTNADFRPRPWAEQVLYELHLGTFTPQGTLDAAAGRLEHLRDLGVTAVELMPVAQCPGGRNWGYDGVGLFAVQNNYGGPEALAHFVDAAHGHGLAVLLDVVYNHLGPEGNYLSCFGPYFTRRHPTPWGEGLNFDGPDSGPVRTFFLANARYWLRELHLDGLRLDATNTIVDGSPVHILAELSEAVAGLSAELGREKFLVAETDANDPEVIRPRATGGQGMTALWNDDFHHGLHALLTRERGGYYADFGRVGQLAKACRDGFAQTGEVSRYRGRAWGQSARGLPPERFVIFSQNHDQIGNRADGARLLTLAGPAAARLAAGLTLLSPQVPLLFMGEEYGETSPFLYFADHSDPWLPKAVRQGRRAWFRLFGWDVPGRDPFAASTLASSRLDWDRAAQPAGRAWLDYYRALLTLRRALYAPVDGGTPPLPVISWTPNPETLTLEVTTASSGYRCFFHFGVHDWHLEPPYRPGVWTKVLDSSDAAWGGPGAVAPERLCRKLPLPRHSCLVYADSPSAPCFSTPLPRTSPLREKC